MMVYLVSAQRYQRVATAHSSKCKRISILANADDETNPISTPAVISAAARFRGCMVSGEER